MLESSVPTTQRLLLRKQAKDQVSNCTNCALHTKCTQPVPYYGPPTAKIAVVGEAPGKHEDIRNRHFVGPAGQLVRRWFSNTNMDPDSVAWLNVVSCFPGRTPLRAEVEACRDNLRAQLAAIQPEYVLVLGGVASQAFHPSLKISEIRGLWWRVDFAGVMAWALATWHPAAVLRNPGLTEEAMADVRFFRLVSDEECFPIPGDKCVKCHDVVDTYWADIPWCRKHWTQYKGKGGRGRPRMLKDGDRRVAGGVEWEEPRMLDVEPVL